jgi:hypothetical protein
MTRRFDAANGGGAPKRDGAIANILDDSYELSAQMSAVMHGASS